MKKLFVLGALLLVCSCGNAHKHKTAQQIYESGVIDDTADWTTSAVLPDSLLDVLIYKYDTFLKAYRRYRKPVRQYYYQTLFFYKNKLEGTCISHSPPAYDSSVFHYKNNKKNGLAIIYAYGILRKRIFFKDNNCIYEVMCDVDGNPIDSICNDNNVYTWYENGIKLIKIACDDSGAAAYKVYYNNDGIVTDSQLFDKTLMEKHFEPIPYY